jgi:Zn-dependent peptidase ImmA (M78 family)/transcriptional regulator with XRE-family HTH domain
MSASSETENWLNPSMLKWAREWSGVPIETVAEKFKKTAEQIAQWESGEKSPTVGQARKLAAIYERPFLEFFLRDPPNIPAPRSIPDYRMRAGIPPPRETREVLEVQQWVETQRVNALDLFAELGDAPPTLPPSIFAKISQSPDVVAAAAREAIGFTAQEQLALPKSRAEQLPTILRRRLEAFGVLTLRKSEMKAFGIRGICLAEFPLPVIAYSSEAPTAQAFTLGHEFGHILLKESGITGSARNTYDELPIERWCDRFAAAFLMPAEQMRAIVGNAPTAPAPRIEDDELSRLADMFRVSPHAMLIRLVHLKYVRASYYWDVKKPEFDAAEGSYRGFGRAAYYGTRYKNAQGDLYTALVLEAWSVGRITNHNAAEFMGIKNLSHLYDIRDHFAAS